MSRWHQSQDTIRPGNLGFPVVTLLATNTWLVAGSLSILLALQLGGLPLGGGASTLVACAAILVCGLPHGTLDLEIIKCKRGTGRSEMRGLLSLYLGLAAAMAAIWYLAPVAALGIFLVVAVVHFAEDWPELSSAFLAQGMAIALLAAPALLHVAELERLFVAVAGYGDAAIVADVLLLLAPTSVAVAVVAIWTLWRTGSRDQAMTGALMLMGMVLLPPVIGFALFFCLYHSPRHLRTALSRVRGVASAPRVIVLLTLAALGIAATLFAGEVRADFSAQAVAASFMTLSLLTVPHMLVPGLVDASPARTITLG